MSSSYSKKLTKYFKKLKNVSKMKIFIGLFGLISAKTECNGSKYSPLGCFTDDPPFSVPGYRPARMPQSVSTVNPTFKLTNSRYTDNSIDWQNVATNRFVSGQMVTVLTHGWTAEWDDASFLNDGRDAFKRKDRDFRNLIDDVDIIRSYCSGNS